VPRSERCARSGRARACALGVLALVPAIAAAGEPAAVGQLEQEIRNGPPGARVDQVAVRDDPAAAINAHFSIR